MSEIKIGNDDFILYIRKNQRADGLMSKTKNDRLGRMIWEFIRDNKVIYDELYLMSQR